MKAQTSSSTNSVPCYTKLMLPPFLSSADYVPPKKQKPKSEGRIGFAFPALVGITAALTN